MGGGARATVPRIFSLVLCLAVLGSAVPAEACVTVYASASAPRAITIVGDSQFLTTPEVKGGTGTPADPYRIEDLTITNPSTSGIAIRNTNASFIIRNVTITRPPPSPPDGYSCCNGAIDLSNLKNGKIVDSVIRWGRQGIHLYNVTAVAVENTLVEGGVPGFLIQESTAITLSGNHLVNTTITLEASTVERAASHTISEDNLLDGVPIVYRTNCAHETVAQRVVALVLVVNCTDVRLQGIEMAGTRRDVRVLWSSDVILADVNASSITLSRIQRATVRGSTFSSLNVEAFEEVAVEASGSPLEQGTSIRAVNGTGLRIEGNDFRGSGGSMILLGDNPPYGCACLPGPPPRMTVEQALVLGNTLRDQSRTAITIRDAPAAVIRGNRILNVSDGVQGFQVPGLVVEDNEWTGGESSDTAIELSGEGSLVRDNTISGFQTGISTMGADNLEIVGNVIESRDAGLRLGMGGPYHVDGNHLTGGSLGLDYAWQAAAFEFGPSNTINGLPLRFHRGCSNVTYDGALLGAVVFLDCENIRLSNISFKDVSQPIILMGVSHFALEDLTIENASMGIALRSVWAGSLNRSILQETGGVEIYDAFDVSLNDNLIENGSGGVTVYNAGDIVFNNNLIEGGDLGPMVLYNDFELKFKGNALVGGGIVIYGSDPDNYASHDFDTTNTVDGLPLVYVSNQNGVTIDPQAIGQLIVANCTEVTIRGLVASGPGPMMTLAFDSGVSISNVSLSSSRWSAWIATEVEGVAMRDSSINGSSIGGWYLPAALLEGAGAVLFDHVTFNGSGGAGLQADNVWDFTISNSTLEGYYGGARLKNTDGLSVRGSLFSGALGGLGVDGANNATIEGSQFRGGAGIWIGNSRESAILGNDFEGLAGTAIHVSTSTQLIVRENTIRNSSVGISFRGERDAYSVTVERNVIQFNSVGIDLNLYAIPSPTNNNVLIRNNTVEQNGIGVMGNNSKGVTLMHNRFLNNTVQARVVTGAAWDGGYLVGGNYWSDYVGKDECSGEDQDVCPDPDEFGDAPLCVGAPTGAPEGIDRYPLMTQIAPPARQPPPPPVVPPTPTALDPIGAGLPALALILAFLAAGVFVSMRRRPIEKLEEEETERLS